MATGIQLPQIGRIIVRGTLLHDHIRQEKQEDNYFQ